MSDYVKWFKELSKDSIEVAGGKGANLGEMFNIGLPIPGGFVVSAQAYKHFVESTNIQPKILEIVGTIDINNTDELQSKAKEVQELISSTPMPEDIKQEIIENYGLIGVHRKSAAADVMDGKEEFVAVRSSATAEDLPEASFAGQQATFLNVKGTQQLVEAVSNCWASLFTARAIYYRSKNNFPTDQVYIAVVVQKMVDSTVSGIMFTVNPATNNAEEIVIEAVYGLGEAIVSGSVNPDLYIVDKASGEIKKREVKKQAWGLFRNDKGENEKRNISSSDQGQQIINDKIIQEYARLGKKIEAHYGRPQDIEWAVEGNDLFIVQARAVTTFKDKQAETCDTDEAAEDCKILVKGETAASGVASGPVVLVHDPSELGKVKEGDVLVTKMTTPDMVPAMQKAIAIVTDEGGMTCHAAIVSREMGTPCIVGTEVATTTLKEGQIITVHASRGIVYEGKIDIKEEAKPEVAAIDGKGAPIVTATDIKVIMDLPDSAQKAAATGADGIGLMRLEIMIAHGGVHPAQWIREGKKEEYVTFLMEGLRKAAEAFKGKPVWVRTSDLRTDEYRGLKGGDQEPKEDNPMMGWHGVRRSLDDPQILEAEFEALKRLHAEGLKNLGIMMPFIIRVEELQAAKEICRKVGMEPQKDIEFGVMIETPASCWIIEDLCKEGIDFVSFGTNDLTQLTLGLDRNNSRIAKLWDEMHPAVLGEIAKVISVCKCYNVKTSICGQAGSKPVMAEFLVKNGCDSISANADAVATIRKVVARTERKVLLDAEREKLSSE